MICHLRADLPPKKTTGVKIPLSRGLCRVSFDIVIAILL